MRSFSPSLLAFILLSAPIGLAAPSIIRDSTLQLRMDRSQDTKLHSTQSALVSKNRELDVSATTTDEDIRELLSTEKPIPSHVLLRLTDPESIPTDQRPFNETISTTYRGNVEDEDDERRKIWIETDESSSEQDDSNSETEDEESSTEHDDEEKGSTIAARSIDQYGSVSPSNNFDLNSPSDIDFRPHPKSYLWLSIKPLEGNEVPPLQITSEEPCGLTGIRRWVVVLAVFVGGIAITFFFLCGVLKLLEVLSCGLHSVDANEDLESCNKQVILVSDRKLAPVALKN